VVMVVVMIVVMVMMIVIMVMMIMIMVIMIMVIVFVVVMMHVGRARHLPSRLGHVGGRRSNRRHSIVPRQEPRRASLRRDQLSRQQQKRRCYWTWMFPPKAVPQGPWSSTVPGNLVRALMSHLRGSGYWRAACGEVWMLHRICLIAGIVSTLMFMTPAVAHDYGVQGHHG